MKRALEAITSDSPRKKRIVENVQVLPAHTEPAPQLPQFAGIQLMRGITAACTLAGFDSMTSSALEMFRAQAEEYMLRFATEVRLSMQNERRNKPAAQDFSTALSRTENTRAPRILRGQLDLKLPNDVSCPAIPPPASASLPAPDFSHLLEPLMQPKWCSWIPRHFPKLPPSHAWKDTDVWPMRETDSRKMREKATEEGMLAEQALRKLASAAKTGQVKANEKRRRGSGRPRDGAVNRPKNEDIFGDVLQDVGGLGEDTNDDTGDRKGKMQTLDIEESLLVNANASHWRGGKRQGLAF